MGSRKKKQKNKATPAEFSTSVTFDDAGVHLPSFVAGLVTSIIGILLIWNHFAGTTVAETPQKAFENTLEVADAEQLSAILLDLEEAIVEAKDAVAKETVCRRFVDVSNKMLTMPLNPEQRQLAVVSNIEGLSTIYGLDFVFQMEGPKVSETMRSTALKYSKDSNKKIVRVARLALLKHNSFERLKQGGYPPIAKVADELVSLLNDYSDHGATVETIQQIINYYNENDVDEGLALMRSVLTGCQSNTSPAVVAMVRQYSDLVKLKSIGYVSAFENRWINGASGEEELFKMSLDLLSGSEFGERIVQRVDRVTQWFEQEDQYERATEIYQQMLDSANGHEDPEVAELARYTAENGLKRLGMVNQKLDFSGLSHTGSPSGPAFFTDRVVVILFWSSEDSNSIDALKQVESETAAWRNQGGRLLAVSKESGSSEEFSALVEPMSEIAFAVNDPKLNGRNLIWEQLPGALLPCAVMVDRDGKVVDVNVPIPEVTSQAGFLLSDSP